MLKITKISATALIFYILFYLQVWGDNHLILYGTAFLSVLSMLIHCIQQGYMNFSNVPYGVWNNLIMVIYTLTTGLFVSDNYATTVSSSVTFAAFSIVCVSICYASSEEGSFEWVLKVLIVTALVCALYAIFRGNDMKGYGRTLSATNNPHSFSAVMSLGIFSVAYIRRAIDERIKLVLSIGLISLFFYSIIQSGSRKYFVSSLGLIVIFIIACLKKWLSKGDVQQRILFVFASIGFLLVALFYFKGIYYQSNMYLRMNAVDNAGNQNRIEFYKKAWEIFLDHPIFGGGYDQFQYLSGTGGYAHSTYAEAIADFGLVGSVIYFTPMIWILFRLLKEALIEERDYSSLLLAAFCLSEIFLGIGQIFFMEFYHFISWMIIFYYSREFIILGQYKSMNNLSSKYIRN